MFVMSLKLTDNFQIYFYGRLRGSDDRQSFVNTFSFMSEEGFHDRNNKRLHHSSGF